MRPFLKLYRIFSFLFDFTNPSFRSLDATELDDVCVSLAKPMKKAVRKTVEEAVFLVRFCSLISGGVYLGILLS